LDQINVFPVADADTGRNLKISLAPLRLLAAKPAEVPRQMLRAATGNAGNIAAAFFQPLLQIEQPDQMAAAAGHGLSQACRAVADPKPGTMLTLFEALANTLPAVALPAAWDLDAIVGRLEKSVADTSDTLPELRQAGVVDAGALGMFIFLEAFLTGLSGHAHHLRPVTERFLGKLKILNPYQPEGMAEQYCVSALIRPQGDPAEARRRLVEWGDSVVIQTVEDHLKVHLHAPDRDALQTGMAQIGQVVQWSDERIDVVRPLNEVASQPVYIMTDAAGSLTVEDAQALGMTLLDSYVVVGDQATPETLHDPAALYAAMADGQKVTTAQASIYQRHQSYLSAVSRFEQVLYLCVGSVYTGNYEAATAWRASHELGRRMTIIDSGAASGRLGIIALATARYARRGHGLDEVITFAQHAIDQSQELVFLDQLKYLAAGGRISKTKGFFGDLLHLKPIITPTAQGAAKVGVARNRSEQLSFALQRLQAVFDPGTRPLILLQYSDNRTWVEESAAGAIQPILPAAEILLRPLSLTSGAHMGPGTWAVAFLPATFNS
jgi:hypothetical protein